MTTSFVVSIDRTSLSLSPLVLSGSRDPGVTLGIIAPQEPVRAPLNGYAPQGFTNGQQLLMSVLQQTLWSFSVMPLVTSEAAADTAYDALAAAINQFAYNVTVTKNGGTAKVWACDPGTISPAGERSRIDLERHVPVWQVTIPCFPVPS